MFDISGISRAGSVQEAIDLLTADPKAVTVAGGSDVLIQVREGRLAGRRLVSIRDIPQLRGISLTAEGDIIIRPLSTFAEVNGDGTVQRLIPTLSFAAGQAGGPQLRNIGTIGGNICNGVTSADTAPTLLTLNAQLELCGPQGVRTVFQEQFYKGPGTVDKAHNELLTAVRISKHDYDGFYGHYIKFAQRAAMDIATLGCAAHIKLSADKKKVAALRLAFGVAGPTPIRCRAAEKQAAGMETGEELLSAVAAAALAETSPRTSWRASKEFRVQLIYELSRRALCESIRKAGGTVQ